MGHEKAPNSRVYAKDLPASAIAPEGLPIVIAFALGSVALIWIAWLFGPLAMSITAIVTGVLCLWCIWFFRDPERKIPIKRGGHETIVSPADGVVCFVGPGTPPKELGLSEDQTLGMTRVSVFMNVFNVHVNRAPIASTVAKAAYRPGKFFNASFDKASEQNERHSLVLRMDDGRTMVCVQIAGLVARRIVCRVKEGATLATGQRYGLIRFGSRVDVYLPQGIAPLVKVGYKSVAGETILAEMSAPVGAHGESVPSAVESAGVAVSANVAGNAG